MSNTLTNTSKTQSKMSFIVESQGDDTVVSSNLFLSKQYALNIFNILADKKYIATHLSKSIPSQLPPEEYFVLISQLDLSLNETMTLKLYKTEFVETGWMWSNKKRISKMIKEISIKAVDVITEKTEDSDDDDSDEEDGLNEQERKDFFASVKVTPHLPISRGYGPPDGVISERGLVESTISDDIYNETKKNEIIRFVQGKLIDIERAVGRQNKMNIAIEMFTKLTEPVGKMFVHHHQRFSDTVRAKMIELFRDENFQEMKEFYYKIFDENMPSTD